jgi:hypothetical protein
MTSQLKEQTPAERVAELEARARELRTESDSVAAAERESLDHLARATARGATGAERTRLRGDADRHTARQREIAAAIGFLETELQTARADAQQVARDAAEMARLEARRVVAERSTELERLIHDFSKAKLAQALQEMNAANREARAAHDAANRLAGLKPTERPFEPAELTPLIDAISPATDGMGMLDANRRTYWRAVRFLAGWGQGQFRHGPG